MAAATVAEVPAVDDGQQRKGLFHGQTGTKPISATVTEAYRHAGASEAPEIVPWSAEVRIAGPCLSARAGDVRLEECARLRFWVLVVRGASCGSMDAGADGGQQQDAVHCGEGGDGGRPQRHAAAVEPARLRRARDSQ